MLIQDYFVANNFREATHYHQLKLNFQQKRISFHEVDKT